jgi:hypothetical protein
MDNLKTPLKSPLTCSKPYYIIQCNGLNEAGIKRWKDLFDNYAHEDFKGKDIGNMRALQFQKTIKQTKSFNKLGDEFPLKYWSCTLVKSHPIEGISPQFRLKDFNYDLYEVQPQATLIRSKHNNK